MDAPPQGPPLSPGEIEFQEKEKEITDAVIRVIGVAKRENQQVLNEEVKAMVVEACKSAVAQTMAFQNTMKGCRRPYIAHSNQLEACLKAIDASLRSIEDVVTSARQEEAEEEIIQELHDVCESATKELANFRSWLYTNDASYLFIGDRSLDAPEPENPDQWRADMLRTPRWMLQTMVVARRGMMEAEEKWQMYLKESNELKLKLSQLTDDSELKQEIRKKDELIKRLNQGLRTLYEDMEKKSSAMRDQESELQKRADQLKALAAMKNSSVGSPSLTRTTSVTQVVSNRIDPRLDETADAALKRRVTELESKSVGDNEELRRLRGEVQRLKYLLKGTKATGEVGDGPSAGSENPFPPRPSFPRLSLGNLGYTISSTGAPRTPSGSELKDTPSSDAEAAGAGSGSIAYSTAQWWLTESNKRVALGQLLVRDFTFIDVLGKSIPPGKEAEDISAWLVKLFRKQDIHMEVMMHLIRTEVSNTKALNTLFRGEDIASRVLRVYTRKTGTKYAFKILNHLIKEVSDNNIFLEIDPNRATPAMNLKQNFMQLETLAQRFFDSVVNSLQWVPPEFIKLCAFMAYESKKRFEDSEDVVVAGFLFLRFLCPAISSPEGFGLAAVGTPEARRTLLLVGKIMQNLANGVKFKEDFLTDMNRFLDKNEIACKEFFRKMRSWPRAIDGEGDLMMDISRMSIARKDKIKAQLEPFEIQQKKWDVSVFQRLDERARVLMDGILSGSKPGDPENPEKANAMIALMTDNEDFLPQFCIAAAADQDVDNRKKLADSLVTLLYPNNHIENLARTVVQAEISQAFTAYGFLNQSLTRAVFVQYTQRFCTGWIKSVLGELIDNIVNNNVALEIDETRLAAANRKSFNIQEAAAKLVKLTAAFADLPTNSLNSAPRLLWSFANVLTNNTAQDVFQFIALNFLCPVIQDPVTYGIVEMKPPREAARTLQLIADVLRNYANNAGIVIEGIAADLGYCQKLVKSYATWAMEGFSGTFSSEQVDIPEALQCQAALSIAKWMVPKFESNMAKQLEKYSVTQTIRYGVAELVDSMAAPTKSAHATIHASASSGALDSPNSPKVDPKDAKKIKELKEKEEKERKKKEKEDAKKKEKEEKEKKKLLEKRNTKNQL